MEYHMTSINVNGASGEQPTLKQKKIETEVEQQENLASIWDSGNGKDTNAANDGVINKKDAYAVKFIKSMINNTINNKALQNKLVNNALERLNIKYDKNDAGAASSIRAKIDEFIDDAQKHIDNKETIDKDGNINPNDLDYLMPWSKTLPDECRKPRR